MHESTRKSDIFKIECQLCLVKLTFASLNLQLYLVKSTFASLSLQLYLVKLTFASLNLQFDSKRGFGTNGYKELLYK